MPSLVHGTWSFELQLHLGVAWVASAVDEFAVQFEKSLDWPSDVESEEASCSEYRPVNDVVDCQSLWVAAAAAVVEEV